jgi:imidazolonepropionase-like amidohydrolase
MDAHALAEAERKGRIEGLREAAAIAHKRIESAADGCERGHTEWDTGAFVCSNRHGCLCAEHTEEAEAIETAITARIAKLEAQMTETTP